jgi:hypothetical protein
MGNASLFLRLLGEEDKGVALAEAVRSVAAGAANRRVFEVAPESFEQVPGTPFAYWVSEIEDKVSREVIDEGCLLCSEDKPHHCHRRLVAEYLRDKWGGLEIRHI